VGVWPKINQALVSLGLACAYVLVVLLHGCLGFSVVLASNRVQFWGVLQPSRAWLGR